MEKKIKRQKVIEWESRSPESCQNDCVKSGTTAPWNKAIPQNTRIEREMEMNMELKAATLYKIFYINKKQNKKP